MTFYEILKGNILSFCNAMRYIFNSMDHTVGLWNLLLAQQALPYVLPSEPHT